MTLDEAINIGRAAMVRGDVATAEATAREILQRHPNELRALDLLGHVAIQRGRYDDAAQIYAQAVQLAPAAGIMHHNLALAQLRRMELAPAEQHYRKSIELGVNRAEALDGLGMTLLLDGRSSESEAWFLRALSVDPNFADAHHHLSMALSRLARDDEAISHARRAAELTPGKAAIWLTLVDLLDRKLLLPEMIAAAKRALQIDPRQQEVATKLASLLWNVGKFEEANRVLRELLKLDPAAAQAHSRLLFDLNFSPDVSREEVFREHVIFGEVQERLVAAASSSPQPPRPARAAKAKLRIGFVSADFYAHAISHFLRPLLGAIDREKFEVICYSAVEAGDVLTGRFRQQADRWVDIAHQSDDQAAERIRADSVDVLIDLGGHAPSARLLIFARKPAPVQITWLGYLGTTGLAAMDFRFTDPFLESEGAARYFTEAPLMLPQTYWCYQPPEDAPAVKESRDATGITFASLSSFGKYSAKALSTWAQLLARVPDSRLLLHARYRESHDVALAPFLQHGIARERIEFLPSRAMAEYLETYNRVDVALDPFPYGGGATTCEALWMGVPVVTLAGDVPSTRTGVSILSNIGLPELIAQTTEQYIDAAIAAAARAGEYRRTMRARMQSSPVLDAKSFARAFENAVVGAFS